MNKIRNQTYDIARGISILTVVITHTGFMPMSKIISPLIGSWMLPIFAFIGGCLFNSESSVINVVVKKFRRIMIPYFVFGFFSIMGWLFLRSHYPEGLIFASKLNAFTDFFIGKNVFNGPLWFLPCYFFSLVFLQIFLKFSRSWGINYKKIFLLLLVTVSLYAISNTMTFVFRLELSMLFTSYLLAGHLMRNKLVYKSKYLSTAVFLFIPTSYLNGMVDLYQSMIGNPLLFLITSVSGIYIILHISSHISGVVRSYFAQFGKESLMLMAIHWPVIQWSTYLLYGSSISKRLRINPTITSFWIPESTLEKFPHLSLVLLAFYLTIVFLVFLLCIKLRNKIDELYLLWKYDRKNHS